MTDLERVKELFDCDDEKALFLIKQGLNIDYIKNKSVYYIDDEVGKTEQLLNKKLMDIVDYMKDDNQV